jgi:hypothetical protein
MRSTNKLSRPSSTSRPGSAATPLSAFTGLAARGARAAAGAQRAPRLSGVRFSGFAWSIHRRVSTRTRPTRIRRRSRLCARLIQQLRQMEQEGPSAGSFIIRCPEGRIWPYRMGTGPVPRARCVAKVGGLGERDHFISLEMASTVALAFRDHLRVLHYHGASFAVEPEAVVSSSLGLGCIKTRRRGPLKRPAARASRRRSTQLRAGDAL